MEPPSAAAAPTGSAPTCGSTTSRRGSPASCPTCSCRRRNLPPWLSPLPGELRVVNPATLEVVGSVPTVRPEAVQELVAEARLAQERFGAATLDRAARARSCVVADVVLERADEIADTIIAETAKPRRRGIRDASSSRRSTP